MGQGAGRAIDDADRFVLEGIEFVPSWARRSQPGSLTLLKTPAMVEDYRALLAPYDRPRLVELGISQGGSVALIAILARPAHFVALELAPDRIAPLDAALEQLGLADTVRPYYGIDQADRERVAAIMAEEFDGQPLDLVVDDASHHYDPTVASFEVLFPLLRPGGVYVIEDWTWQDLMADNLFPALLADPESEQYARMMERLTELMEGKEIVAEPPISRLAIELSLAVAQSGGVVAKVSCDENWITVHRGTAELDPDGFRITDLYDDAYGQLVKHRPPAS